MITCPKCGFEQPEDPFCAKCGIMIEGFVPETRNIFVRIFTSPAFLAILGASVLGGGVLFYFQQASLETESRVVALPTPAPKVAAGTAPAAAASSPMQPTSGAPTDASKAGMAVPGGVAAPPPAAVPAGPAAPGALAPEALAAATENPGSEETLSEIPARIEFVLVTDELLERINHDLDRPLGMDRFATGVANRYKTFHDMISKDPGFKVQGSDSNKLTVGQPTMFFKGGRHPKLTENLGVYVEITPQKSTAKSTDYVLQLKRNLLDINPSTGEPTLASSTINESVTIPRGSGLAMSGILPARAMPDSERENLANIPILKILLMSNYQPQNKELELIMFFYPDTGQ